MVIIYSRVWINRERLPILLEVSRTRKINISLSPFAPASLISHDRFGRPVPRQPAHFPLTGNMVLTLGVLPDFPRRRPFIIYLNRHTYSIGSVPSSSGHAIAYRWRSLPRVRRHRNSSPQGCSSNGRSLRITMDQLMCAYLFPHPLLV